MLTGKTIVLGVTGGIAAYKAAEVVRLLVKEGATVRVVMTKNAQEFITPLTMQTLSGNPVATTAGLATLRLATDDVYAGIDRAAALLAEAADKALTEAGVPHLVQAGGNMFSAFLFDDEPAEVRDFAAASGQNVERYKAFFHSMLDRVVSALPAAARAAAAVPARGAR